MAEINTAWKRACDKCSPHKMTAMSPINPIYAHTYNKNIMDDLLLEALSLCLMLSEENQYTNLLSTVHEFNNNPERLAKVLRGIRSTSNLLKRIENIHFISRGSFGTVFEATDSFTGNQIAVKNIIPENTNQYRYLLSMWKIFFERNILMMSNDCPFITHLIASFQSTSKTSFWIVMELCICDLESFSKHLHSSFKHEEIITRFSKEDNIIQEIKHKSSLQLKYPFHDLIFIYFFEMLCALNFLSDRHIVHCDLKTDNILIARNGHIKLTDLGAAQVYRLVNKRSALHIINDFKNMKKIVHQYDYEFKRSGNTVFLDPETTLRYLKADDNETYLKVMAQYKLDASFADERTTRQSFQSDLYAVGAVVISMIMGGALIIYGGHYGREVMLRYKLHTIDIRNMNVTLAFNKTLFNELMFFKFKKSFIDEKKDLIMLLIGTISRRESRGLGLTRNITVFRNNDVVVEPAIDIKKVQTLKYYLKKNITMESVTSLILPKSIMNFCGNQWSKEDKNNITISDLGIQDNPKPLSSLNFQISDA